MRNMKKRVWALVLAFVLVVGLLPTNTFATEVDGDVNVTSVAETIGNEDQTVETIDEVMATDYVETVDNEDQTVETIDTVMAIDEESVVAVAEGEWNGSSISNVTELIAFRDAVNNGDGFAGKTVELLADIDMSGIDWSVNIGDDCNATFDGIFDGNGHTISNLSSTETAQKSDGYVCTGLFGAIAGSAVIKDLTLTNVNISSGAYTGNNVSALVGFAYNATGTISNVNVTGSINGADISGVGAIVGYVYGGNLAIENCTVEVDVNGAAFVGGIVGYGGNAKVANCTVSNSTITAKDCVAGVMGLSLNGAVATNNTVANTDITATHDNWKNSAAVVVGTMAGKNVTVSGTSCTNVTLNGVAGNAIVGSEYKEHPTTPVAKVEASVGDVYYLTLQEAIDAAKAGDTVKLDADITTDKTFKIAADDVIILDLNGKTISGTDNTEKGNSALINISKGNLTVTGNGTLKLTATVDRDWSAASAVISNNQGTLTIENGTIEHLGGTDMAYAIDNLTNGGIGDVTLNVKGGRVVSTYRAIRQFANSATKVNNLFVTGGEITSTSGNYGVWLQSSNANANKAVLNITGGEVSSVYVYAPSDASEVKVKIANDCVGTIKEAVSEGYAINAKYNNVSYNSLVEAVKEAVNGGEVTLVADIALAERLTITNDLVINLNGKTVTSPECVFVVENGTLTIKGEGNVKANTDNDDGMAIAVWARGGHAVIYGGSYYFGSDNVDDAYDHQTEGIYTSGNGTIKIYGGEYFSGKGVWTLNEHDSNRGTLTVYGGKFHNFDPSNNVSEGPNTNFVADGYWAREYEGGYWMVAEKGEIKVETEKTETSVSATLTEEDAKAAIEGDYTIDVTVVDEEVTSAAIEVESSALTTLADNNKAVVLETNVGTINFNSEAVNRLANVAEGNALEISISDEKTDELNRGDIITLEAKVGENNAFVAGAGTATITVKTTLEDGFVYYMASNGKLEQMTNVEFKDGTVTWVTNHFSDYLISATDLMPKAPANNGSTGSGSSDSDVEETPVTPVAPTTTVTTNETVVEEETVEIEEEETPLVSGEEEAVTEEPTVDIEEEEVPLVSGETSSMNFVWVIVIALVAVAGVIAVFLLKKKVA